MSSKPVRYVQIIDRLERLNLSTNGNPRFRIFYRDGQTAITQSDAMVSYGLENRENLGVPVTVTATRAGRVYGVKPFPVVPDDFPVRPLGPDDDATVRATCGACLRSWDDAVSTSWTPAPSARCPFEYFHEDPDA